MGALDSQANLAYQAWGITMHEEGRELHGPCPFCLEGKDRFIIWPEGNFWCRVCERSGRVPGAGDGPLSRDTLANVLREKRTKQAKRLTEWQLGYNAGFHDAMKNVDLRAYWLGEGITEESIERYQLGYTPSRTFEGEGGRTFTSAAYTIPLSDPISLQPVNCVYRLMNLPPEAGGKYRQEPGLPPASFYSLPKRMSGAGIIVEGPKKAIVISQLTERRIQVIGWPGIMPSEELYLQLETFADLWIILDPGPGRAKAVERARHYLGDRLRDVEMPVKPDDAVVKYGMTLADFRQFLVYAR